MGWIEENMKSTHIRQIVSQAISLGMVISSALIIWKGLICITGSESPVVVVLSGSMEPGFKRGDILFLYMNRDPIRAGQIVVFNDGRDVPIVHRVIEETLIFTMTECCTHLVIVGCNKNTSWAELLGSCLMLAG
ncbi:hypothetical protein E1A91_D06G065600v1 [Gossypium mustelinum]|uniref:signal peptidase I n=1 Tax=Gossypium mustelinum TaxID=34275 RepID=A0A5D2UGC7_GOSMU|nr:hypothetical protein E1A91_D06G065600v1 [Gossypium mustelinum]